MLALVLRIAAGLLAAIVIFGGVSLSAQIMWNPSGTGVPVGGTGTWNTSSARWTWDYGVTYQTWSAASTDAATFGGTGGTVTLVDAITAGGLTFNSTGYTLNTSGSGALTLVNSGSGFAPEVSVAQAGHVATINAPLAGTHGVYFRGPGTVNLTGASTLTGGVNIQGTTVRLFSATGSLDSVNGLAFTAQTWGVQSAGTFILDNT
ncbi:MAG: hypothetical protein NTV51_29705, partial [Verrucomicrobia bacterium]|nr:hypothetical protein [Verrucomicrobiota bacterium]